MKKRTKGGGKTERNGKRKQKDAVYTEPRSESEAGHGNIWMKRWQKCRSLACMHPFPRVSRGKEARNMYLLLAVDRVRRVQNLPRHRRALGVCLNPSPRLHTNDCRLGHRHRRPILISISRYRPRVGPRQERSVQHDKWRLLLQRRERRRGFALPWPHQASMTGCDSPLLHQSTISAGRDHLDGMHNTRETERCRSPSPFRPLIVTCVEVQRREMPCCFALLLWGTPAPHCIAVAHEAPRCRRVCRPKKPRHSYCE